MLSINADNIFVQNLLHLTSIKAKSSEVPIKPEEPLFWSWADQTQNAPILVQKDSTPEDGTF